MKLLTEKIKATLPKLDSQKGPGNPTVHVKLFDARIGWEWYVTEGKWTGDDFICFGFVKGDDVDEWGYFSIGELEASFDAATRLGVERDRFFTPKTLSEAVPLASICHVPNRRTVRFIEFGVPRRDWESGPGTPIEPWYLEWPDSLDL